MNLPELRLVKPEETELIDQLAKMMGTSFLEEGWTQAWLSALDRIGTSSERKLEISQAIIRSDFTVGSPYNCVYTLPDFSAAAGAYLSRDLKGRTWRELEDEAIEAMMSLLSEDEQQVLEKRASQMKTVSDFSWMYQDIGKRDRDFVHFYAIGVDPNKRGSGAFRRLFVPFLEYASEHQINCYLECYSEKTESVYSHFGFEVVKRISDPVLKITERCMRKRP